MGGLNGLIQNGTEVDHVKTHSHSMQHCGEEQEYYFHWLRDYNHIHSLTPSSNNIYCWYNQSMKAISKTVNCTKVS